MKIERRREIRPAVSYGAELLEIRGIRKTDPVADPVTIRQLAGAEAPQYGNSWAYLAQAADSSAAGGEALGYTYHENGCFAMIGMFERPATREQCFHVIRPMGQWTPSRITELCSALHALSGTPVYLKKLTAGQAAAWEGDRFQDAGRLPWHPSAPLEDDTYEEILIDLPATLRLLDDDAADNELRRKYRSFRSDFGQTAVREVYTPAQFQDGWKVVEGFFAGVKEFSAPENYLSMLQRMPSGTAGVDYFASLYRMGRNPAGLFLADRVGSTVAGVYANLTAGREWRYLSEWILLNEFRTLLDAGVQTVNLGGSETAGLDKFKRKFRVSGTNAMRWLVYR